MSFHVKFILQYSVTWIIAVYAHASFMYTYGAYFVSKFRNLIFRVKCNVIRQYQL